MNNEKIIFSSVPIEISEHKDYKLATFLISVLDEYDLNGRMIPKEVGELYHSTILGFPIVAKLVTDYMGNPIDFAGHEMQLVIDEDGEEQAKFNTFPIGAVVSSYIEERMVDGYDGLKSCIMIQAKLWSTRFPQYFTVLDKLWAENNVKSSWELVVSQTEKTLKGKILKAFSFLGNCLLGSNVRGAVSNAGIYEYAELNAENPDNTEIELAKALSADIYQISNITSERQEEKELEKNKDTKSLTAEPVIVTEPIQPEVKDTKKACAEKETPTQTSALTERDLRSKIQDACRSKTGCWCWISYHFPIDKTVWVETDCRLSELNYLLFTYEVDGEDNVIISDPTEITLTVSIADVNTTLAQKDEALIKANERIQELSTKVSNLEPFKEACETAERKRIETETAQKRIDLKATLEKSKLFSEEEINSAEICNMIETVNENAVKNLITDKFMASLDAQSDKPKVDAAAAKIETAAVATPKANINNSDTGTGFSIKELITTYSNK